MTTLKIGRSSTNDISISDVTVSSQHAIITILDTKEVRIKDLNSTNGTFVNDKRITTETAITANDVIKVGNSTLDWVKYLNEKKKDSPPPVFSGDASAIKNKKTIGRTAENNIVINHSDVSGSHAQLIEKVNGDIVITDSGSTNGTFVNGQKVSMHTLRSGDRVMIANKYPLNWENVFGGSVPQKSAPKHLKTILIAAIAATVVIIGAVGFLLFQRGKSLTAEEIYVKYEKSVVMIYATYNYHVDIGGNKNLEDYVNNIIKENISGSLGSGFYVSPEGKIVTNKHVAQPWNLQEAEQIKKSVQALIKEVASQSKAHQIEYLPLVNEAKVTGQLLSIGIIPNKTYVNSPQDIIPCHFVKTTENDDIDIAIIQRNQLPTTDSEITIIDLNQAIINNEDIVVGRTVYTIGFPGGISFTNTKDGIKSVVGSGQVSQSGDEYKFMFNASSWHGASGSPVFNDKGQLVGVAYAGQEATQGYNYAIKAKYAVELAK